MELITLNEDFQPENLIENYESLIWSERYSKNGDFQLQTTDVQFAVNALPKESFVSLRESTVPMIVEDHKIEKSKTAASKVTITGRTVETVLERRGSVNTLPSASPRTAWIIDADKESDAAYKAIRVVLDLDPLNPAISPLDAIPEINLIEPADYSILTTNSYEIKPGKLYPTILELLNTTYRGIKAVRPVFGDSQIGIEIYNGADRTNLVVFDARFDQFDSAKYLLTEQGSANVGYIYGSNGSQMVLKTAGPEPSGLARRVLVLDQTSDNTTDTVDIRRTRGLIELYKNNALALFDGQVSMQVADGFNTAYFLGDIINLVGEYGLSQPARVAEFIRTSDASGSKSYPTFEAVF